MKKIVIAIDGYSSGGKSTFAKAIASRLGYIFIDTGAMYRAVTLFALRSGMIRNGEVDRKALVEALGRIRIGFRYNPEKGKSDIYLDGENVEDEIRGIEVSTWVSHVSSIAEVRALLVHLQQRGLDHVLRVRPVLQRVIGHPVEHVAIGPGRSFKCLIRHGNSLSS